MTIDMIWMIIIGVSAPIAGVVAFYLQLKKVKKINLENNKLYLEINQLKEEKRELESQIKIPTSEEIERYGRPDIPLFSRKSSSDSEERNLVNSIFDIDWGSLLIAMLVVGFMGYFFYDIYRVGLWFLRLL